ncbi:Phosphatidylserine lipase ABHD16A, partial [Galemys pyrenaicus]
SSCMKPFSRSAKKVLIRLEAEPVRADVKGTQHLRGRGGEGGASRGTCCWESSGPSRGHGEAAELRPRPPALQNLPGKGLRQGAVRRLSDSNFSHCPLFQLLGESSSPLVKNMDTYYQPRALEKHADSILALASVFWSISYYSSPFAFFYLYRKGYLSLSKVVPFSHYAGTLLLLLAGVACLRGIGRWTNPQYRQFITILEATHRNQSAENKRQLASYNFDFRSWPVDFHWEEPSSRKESRGGPSRRGVALLRPEPLHRGKADTLLDRVKKLPCQITSLLVAHTLGRRMLYPGSVYLLQKALMPVLLQGQARLVEEYNGRRAKLLACDGNEIDTMFVDRRGTAEPQGQKLVICCEGNAGFYEVGCVSTPLEAGYSVLGWNHPGFAGSTGVPFPQNEANAMDVVIQYAIYRLGFQPQDIILYAWSIGGFTATWAAMSYPDISAVILDASFDDLVPLALKVMPDSWRGLVTRTVRQHLNLNNAEQLCRYQGPVLLIRRTKDEIITTTVPEDIMSNRGNDLLLKLLQHRRWEVEEDWCLSVLRSYQTEHGPDFPWSVGEDMSAEGRRQLALFLAKMHLHNFEATHCTPLPTQNFQMPWHL